MTITFCNLTQNENRKKKNRAYHIYNFYLKLHKGYFFYYNKLPNKNNTKVLLSTIFNFTKFCKHL